jgi:hypothetical protein
VSNLGQGEAITRDKILHLLSEAESKSFKTRRAGKVPSVGEDYIDLANLDRGVQNSSCTATPVHALLKSAVSAETWTKILNSLHR